MDRKVKITDAGACVHCHLCQKNCSFLGKYQIDIGDTDSLRELSYHCFLCGRCSQVCPKGIDGRQIVLNMRRQSVEENGGKLREKGYGMLLWEKKDYRFRNYKNARGKSVLFPGCNFPSFFPETTRYLAGLLREKAGMGVVFDCCGKPVAELGMKGEEERILREMDQRFQEAGVEEVVMLCPNCYHFLKDRLSVKLTTIYKKLEELGLGQKVSGEAQMFLPCPERDGQEMLRDIRPFLVEKIQVTDGGQCCGLGGSAGVKEPNLAGRMPESIDRSETFYTYCASCSGNLARKGYMNTEHILIKILGRDEKPDTKGSLWNRIKSGYWKEKKV